MIHLLWVMFRCWFFREFVCRHTSTMVEATAMKEFQAFLAGELTLEEYRSRDVPLAYRVCIRCGKALP